MKRQRPRSMPRWRDYQTRVAQLFQDLGCEVKVDFTMVGARGRHDVDVWVRFDKMGLEQIWIVECKLWNRPVPKEKILAFRSVVEDVGASRGILIAESGHQAGAFRASAFTNITLTSLSDLSENSRCEFLSNGLRTIGRRASALKDLVFSQYEWTQHSRFHHSSRRRSDCKVDEKTLTKVGGAASVLCTGVEQAGLGKFPAPVHFLSDGNTIVRARSLDEFVRLASGILDELESQIGPLSDRKAD